MERNLIQKGDYIVIELSFNYIVFAFNM